MKNIWKKALLFSCALITISTQAFAAEMIFTESMLAANVAWASASAVLQCSPKKGMEAIDTGRNLIRCEIECFCHYDRSEDSKGLKSLMQLEHQMRVIEFRNPVPNSVSFLGQLFRRQTVANTKVTLLKCDDRKYAMVRSRATFASFSDELRTKCHDYARNASASYYINFLGKPVPSPGH